jgi:hypothetical protein
MGRAGDCVARAIAIATDKPYREVYDELTALGWCERYETYTPDAREYINGLGWHWTPTRAISSSRKVHLRADELPLGRLIVYVAQHLVAVIDGVIHDTYDSSRGGTRRVRGFYQPAWVDWPPEGAVS